MTDRELLEKAAKAAGYTIVKSVYQPGDLFLREGNHENILWNPLADDGDVFRLAVKRRIDVKYYQGLSFDGKPNRVICGVAYKQETQCAEGYTDDASEATRRAIVRAAASMEVDK